MACYIVCHKKRNNPRMDVQICQKKCDLKQDCREYISYRRISVQSENTPMTTESQAVSASLP